MGVLEQYITLFQITPKNALNAKREWTKLAQRRRNKQAARRKPRSTGSRPARTGILGESAVDAIRAGKTVLTRHGRGRRSTGDPVSRPAAPAADTGTISPPNGGASGNSKRESGAATSHSDSPFLDLLAISVQTRISRTALIWIRRHIPARAHGWLQCVPGGPGGSWTPPRISGRAEAAPARWLIGFWRFFAHAHAQTRRPDHRPPARRQ